MYFRVALGCIVLHVASLSVAGTDVTDGEGRRTVGKTWRGVCVCVGSFYLRCESWIGGAYSSKIGVGSNNAMRVTRASSWWLDAQV